MDYPKNVHVVFCPNKQHSSESFTCLDLVTLPVVLSFNNTKKAVRGFSAQHVSAE